MTITETKFKNIRPIRSHENIYEISVLNDDKATCCFEINGKDDFTWIQQGILEDFKAINSDRSFSPSCYTYDVRCCKTFIHYYLVSRTKVTDIESLDHCVCIPFNYLNLMKFYSEYMLPFCDKTYMIS
jgi:hypothetical protein